MRSPTKTKQTLSFTPVPTGLLQRQCASRGQHTLVDGECGEYQKKRLLLQRRTADQSEVSEVPPIVHEALNSPSQSLDFTTRHLMESHFGHDFSQVRVHTDAQASESAHAVNAVAYTVGHDLVFARGQYTPGTRFGNYLLAHELSHVVQQSNAGFPTGQLQIQAPTATAETEADNAAKQVMSGLPVMLLHQTSLSLMRRLIVEHPTDPIPNLQGNGLVQTNAETIEQYLQTISSQGRPTVDRTSGRVSMSNPKFCQSRGFWNRLGRGITSGFVRGAEIGSYFLGVGAIPGSILGALIGGVAGIFAPDSQAEESSTPTGSTCLCDFVNSPNPWTIRIDDTDTPLTGDTFVRVQSPNSPRRYGAATISGRLETVEPWLALAHELCGHAWLQERRQSEGEEDGERHHRTVERENLIRQEHGIEARGFRLRDPYCGESFYRERANPEGSVHWQPLYNERTRQIITSGTTGINPDETYLDQCQQMRETYLGDLARQYRVDQRIP
jgi:hypothetical protein